MTSTPAAFGPCSSCAPPTPRTVRGALLAKGPDSSLGEVHRGYCSEDNHMEEEKVEVKVREDEVEDGETNEKCEERGRREIKHSGA